MSWFAFTVWWTPTPHELAVMPRSRSTLPPHSGGAELPLAVNICVGRGVQEGLTNAWRHAEGAGQQVLVTRQGDDLTVTVRDHGPGLQTPVEDGYGLAGLAGWVESLGGSLTLRNRKGGALGSELVMAMDVGLVE